MESLKTPAWTHSAARNGHYLIHRLEMAHGCDCTRNSSYLFDCPYDGTPTGASHLLGSGWVVNMADPQRAPISLSPILQIHMSGGPTTAENAKGVPVTATFGRAS